MSFHIAYVLPEPTPPVDGDHLASAHGWLAFGDWVLARPDEFPELAHLAQEGWLEDDEPLAELEEELGRVAGATEDVAAISAHLLAAVKARPDGCVGVIVTDGEAGAEDDDEDE